jgi:hypothetical protein
MLGLPTLNFTRLRRVARKPPSYVLRRVGQELRQELHQRQLRACSVDRGPLTAARIVPGGTQAAAVLTLQRVTTIGAFPEAIDVSRADEDLCVQIRRRSELALERRMELFGDDPVTSGIPPAWNTDPHTGLRWPTGFHRRLDVFDIERTTDIKLVWELSRLRHCVALAQAVAVLDDETALQALNADLADWRLHNPLGWTVNWTVGMEVALRAVNLICIDGVVVASGRELADREALVTNLYQHGWFLRRNLEIGDINGNHFLANAVGLVWLGTYFGDVGEGREWLEQGLQMARQAAREQVLDDGLDHEGSLPYHVLVSEMFLIALAAAGGKLAEIEEPVGRMLDAAVAFTDTQGQVPDLGDDDGGRVAAFTDTPSNDARRVLALGGALLQHAGAAHRGQGASEDALWLAGAQRLTRSRGLVAPTPTRGPAHFSSGGLVVMCLGEEDRVVLDAGPIGFRGRGGHGHLDALSFVAWLGGELIFRDSGTGTYTGDWRLRNELRGANAHNAIIVDGLPYAQLGGRTGLWTIEGDAPPGLLALDGDDHRQHVVLQQRLPATDGVAIVERQLTLSRRELEWRDLVTAPAGAVVQHYLQLPDACTLEEGELRHPRLTFKSSWPAHATFTIDACRRSSAYGSRRKGQRATLTYRSSGETEEVYLVVSTRPEAADP